jgi:hypothetical protein
MNVDSGFLIIRPRGSATFKKSDLLNTWALVSYVKPDIYMDTVPGSGSWFTGEKVWNNNPSTGTLYWYCKTGGQPGTWDSVMNIPKAIVVENSASTLTLSSASTYVFTGTTSTWTLPSLATNKGKRYVLNNAGSGTITLNTAGSDNIKTLGTTINTTSITTGNIIRIVGGPSFWYLE